MSIDLKTYDIEKWINEVDKKYPITPSHFPEILTTREVILNIAGQYQCRPRKIYDLLVELGILDSKQKPANILLENEFAIRSSDLGTPDDTLEESYLMTIRGYEFLLRLVEHELKGENF
ncbi:MAG: hypothetical protein JWR05_377 [Mucilaginibacter sp.]|nr:hypothetical protein [Mucilaginibacter sp.]